MYVSYWKGGVQRTLSQRHLLAHVQALEIREEPGLHVFRNELWRSVGVGGRAGGRDASG